MFTKDDFVHKYLQITYTTTVYNKTFKGTQFSLTANILTTTENLFYHSQNCTSEVTFVRLPHTVGWLKELSLRQDLDILI